MKKPAVRETTGGWIDIAASGHVFVRGNRQPRSGTLPCFNAGSKQAAEELVVFACVLSYDRAPNGDGIYAVPGFTLNDLDSIYRAKDRFIAAAASLKSKREQRESDRR